MSDNNRGKSLDIYIRNIAYGNRESLRALYDEYSRPIFLYALSIVKDHQTAEDVMQETFLNVLKYAASYKRQGSAKGVALYHRPQRLR